MSDDVVRVHPSTLGKEFFELYRELFATASLEVAVTRQGFYIKQREFDDFLVQHGLLDAPVDDFNSNSILRRGAVMRRNEARQSMNTAALKSEDYPAFSVSAAKPVRQEDGSAAVMMRVKLINHYAVDRPIELARQLGTSAKHCARQTRAFQKLAVKHPGITSKVRDYAVLAILAEPILEAVQKMALRWEAELRRTDLTPRR